MAMRSKIKITFLMIIIFYLTKEKIKSRQNKLFLSAGKYKTIMKKRTLILAVYQKNSQKIISKISKS
jgi:hypothetical protein